MHLITLLKSGCALVADLSTYKKLTNLKDVAGVITNNYSQAA